VAELSLSRGKGGETWRKSKEKENARGLKIENGHEVVGGAGG
jgi:hypothetical protein